MQQVEEIRADLDKKIQILEDLLRSGLGTPEQEADWLVRLSAKHREMAATGIRLVPIDE